MLGLAMPIRAAELGAAVRLDRTQSGVSPLPVLVLVKTNTGTVENNLQIILNSGWSVNSNVTVITSGLPNGVTPMPSLSNGMGSGQNINFTIGDLTAGVEYGFYITSGIGNNPNVRDNTWTVATNADSMKINVITFANDQVVVTGKVGALATDFQLTISADKTGLLAENEVITYQVDYGSYLLNSTKPLIISAEWSRGTVSGSVVPSVDVVDFVIGSGSTAYGGIEPVVDIVNRKITWTISSFPANTINKSVSFQLKVNSNYTGASNVNFDVSGYLHGANVVTVDSVLNQTYKPTVVPTSTPTLTPTSTPTSSQSTGGATATSTPAQSTGQAAPTTVLIPQINKIDIVTLTDSGIKVAIDNNVAPQYIKIVYGDKSDSLINSITSVNQLASDWLLLEGLTPGKDYFFRVDVKTSSGEYIKSEIYTFRTAVKSMEPEIDKNSIIFSMANNIILNPSKDGGSINSIVLIPNQNYSYRVNLIKPELIKSARILIRNSTILGINSVYGAEPNSASVDLIGIGNGGYTGHLATPSIPGYYDIVLRIEDTNGNIVEEKTGQLRVIEPILVVDQSFNPIENAKIKIYRYNIQKKIYELIPSEFLGISNPGFTQPNGQLAVSLPEGKYSLEVSEIGYQSEKVEFTIGLGADEKIPLIKLQKTAITLGELIKYYGIIGDNVSTFSYGYFKNLLESGRFFRLLNLTMLIMMVVAGWSYLAKGRNLEWWMLPLLVWQRMVRTVDNNIANKLRGKVIDETTKLPINKAIVYLMDGKNNKVLNKTVTNLLGYFSVDFKKASKYKIAVTKNGYESTDMLDFTEEGLSSNDLKITMENSIGQIEAVEIIVKNILEKIGKLAFTLLLTLILIMQIGYMQTMGTATVLPWFLILWLTMYLWLSK